jgi:hypothetical protein
MHRIRKREAAFFTSAYESISAAVDISQQREHVEHAKPFASARWAHSSFTGNVIAGRLHHTMSGIANTGSR